MHIRMMPLSLEPNFAAPTQAALIAKSQAAQSASTAQALLNTAPALSTSAASVRQAKLVDGAQQFEAMLITEMLKPLRFGESGGAEEDPDNPEAAGESGGGAADTIRSLGVEALSKAIAKSGGFGLSRQIVRQVNAEHDRARK